MDSQVYIVISTAKSRVEAEKLAHLMVERRLAACAQVSGPIKSVYWWQGKVESHPEWKCIWKTTGSRYEALESAIVEAHSYDVPQIVAIPIEKGSRDYLNWLEETLHVEP